MIQRIRNRERQSKENVYFGKKNSGTIGSGATKSELARANTRYKRLADAAVLFFMSLSSCCLVDIIELAFIQVFVVCFFFTFRTNKGLRQRNHGENLSHEIEILHWNPAADAIKERERETGHDGQTHMQE